MLKRKLEAIIAIIIPFIIVGTTYVAQYYNPKPKNMVGVDVIGIGYFASTAILVIVEVVLIHDWWKKPWNRRTNKEEKNAK